MAPPIMPRPNVRYRIQNNDFGTFLERRFETMLFMRVMKDSLQQQWFFEEISDNVFEIRNAQDNEYVLVASSVGPAFAPTCQKVASVQRPGWKLVNSGLNGLYILFVDSGRDDVLLQCKSNDTPSLTEVTAVRQDSTPIADEDDCRWRIVEDSPMSLPDGEGTYTIQTLDGDALHPAPAEGDMRRCSVSKEDLEQHHVEIQNVGNGKATTKNIRLGAFMNVKRAGSEGGWATVLSKTTAPQLWDIKKVGDFAYLISVSLGSAPEPRYFALSIENNIVTLKTMNDVHNHLWFIKVIDAGPAPWSQHEPQTETQSEELHLEGPSQPLLRPQSQPQPQTQPQSQSGFQPRPPNSIPENAIAHGLVEGEYALRNFNGYYLSLDNRGYYITVNKTKPIYFKFELALVPGPSRKKLGTVWISYPDTKTFLMAAHHSDPLHGFTPSLRIKETRDVWEIKVMAPGAPALYSVSYVLGKQSSSLYARGDASDGSEISVASYDAYEWMFIPRPTRSDDNA